MQLQDRTVQPQIHISPEDTPIVNRRKGLDKIAQKLKQQTCNIAYLGASVTAQKQGYRPFLHQWLQDYFDYPHVEINAGIGGLCSSAAVFLMDEDVIQHQPDLCFIEYATGDMAFNIADLGTVIETMVRKLQAVDCEICFLYLYRSDQKFVNNPTIAEYEKIADFHDIPSINAGRYVEKSLAKEEIVFEKIFRDHIHNTVEGGKFIASYLGNLLQDLFQPQNKTGKYLYADTYAKGQIVNIDESMILDPTNYTEGELIHNHNQYHYYQIDTSNEIRFNIKGILVAITTIVGRESGIVEFITPQNTWEIQFWDIHCHYDRFNARMINQYFPEYTPVRIHLTDKPVNYSRCRRKMENTDAIVKNLRVMKLLICGEVLPYSS